MFSGQRHDRIELWLAAVTLLGLNAGWLRHCGWPCPKAVTRTTSNEKHGRGLLRAERLALYRYLRRSIGGTPTHQHHGKVEQIEKTALISFLGKRIRVLRNVEVPTCAPRRHDRSHFHQSHQQQQFCNFNISAKDLRPLSHLS